MKCLILGASGQVGGQLMAHARTFGYSAVGTSRHGDGKNLLKLDITDSGTVSEMIGWYRPEIVFLPAAMTNLDYAQDHPAECFAVNLDGAVNVALAARACHSSLVFFSTDHVFGDSSRPCEEDDSPAPVNTYGQSKAAAEDSIRAILPDDHLILRTSGVFGPEEAGKNFVLRLIRTLKSGLPMAVPRDQFGQPTYGPDLARTAFELFRQGYRGTYHTVGPNRLNRFDFARLVAHCFRLSADHIEGVETSELKQSAPRPGNVWLATNRLRRDIGPDAIRRPTEGLLAMRLSGLKGTSARHAWAG